MQNIQKTVAMQTYAADIQHHGDKDFTCWPREIAIVSLDNPIGSHWLIKPPRSLREMPRKAVNFNRRLTRHVHGIEWSDGQSELTEVEELLVSISHSAVRIYIEGQDNASYLSGFLSCKVVESTKIAPLIDNLSDTDEHCLYHSVLRHERYQCAQNRAMRLRNWLRVHEHAYETILEQTSEKSHTT